MARITKAIAEEVAAKMVAKKIEKQNNLRDSIVQVLYDFYMDDLPNGMRAMYKKHKKYFNVTSFVSFSPEYDLTRHNRFALRFDGDKRKSNRTNYLDIPGDGMIKNLTKKEQKELLEMMDAYDSFKKQNIELREDLERALYGLRTYKRVEENLPEAVEFLPSPTSTALAINLQDIKNRL
tara:strand:+ start:4184 stop:4720 length:537 start_codon:yes stop_codon:yes gene_type:complete